MLCKSQFNYVSFSKSRSFKDSFLMRLSSLATKSKNLFLILRCVFRNKGLFSWKAKQNETNSTDPITETEMKESTGTLRMEVHLYPICSWMQTKAFTQIFTQVFRYKKLKKQIITDYKETWRKYKNGAKNYLIFSFRKRTGPSTFRVSCLFFLIQCREGFFYHSICSKMRF